MKGMNRTFAVLSLVVAITCVGGIAVAAEYEVEVTNLTKGERFTPLLIVSHKPSIHLFEPGGEASFELEAIAEDGAIGPLEALLGTLPGQVLDTNTNGGLLAPGHTAKIKIHVSGKYRRISLVGMLIPTNDTFVAVDSVPVPYGFFSKTVTAVAYDAGTEANDELCSSIPGPPCFGTGPSAPADGDEGRIHVSSGIHGIGDLGPEAYDWRNPVARVTIRRVSY